MSLKGQRTKSDYLEWDQMVLLLQKLERDKNYKFQLLIGLGCFTGLRAKDLLNLRWNMVMNKEFLEINESKTGKARKIKLNGNLVELLDRLFVKMDVQESTDYIFLNRARIKPFNIQYVNRQLKELAQKYNLKITSFSTHTFRKTMARRVWELNEHSEKSLVLLGELFNHSSVKVTKIYLGIREEEIGDIYESLSV